MGDIDKLIPALVKVQAEMVSAKKDSINPFFKSKYADLGAIMEVSRPLLVKNGLAVIQPTRVREDGRMVLVTILAHTSGQSITGEYLLEPTKKDPQGYLAALTYARRGALSAMVGIVSEVDDDGEMASGRGVNDGATIRKPEPKPEPYEAGTSPDDQGKTKAQPPTGNEISKPQQNRLFAIWKTAKRSDEEVKLYLGDNFGYDSTAKIQKGDEYKAIVQWCSKGKEKG